MTAAGSLRLFPIFRLHVGRRYARGAARNIEDAIFCWLEEACALGRAVPLPGPSVRIA